MCPMENCKDRYLPIRRHGSGSWGLYTHIQPKNTINKNKTRNSKNIHLPHQKLDKTTWKKHRLASKDLKWTPIMRPKSKLHRMEQLSTRHFISRVGISPTFYQYKSALLPWEYWHDIDQWNSIMTEHLIETVKTSFTPCLKNVEKDTFVTVEYNLGIINSLVFE